MVWVLILMYEPKSVRSKNPIPLSSKAPTLLGQACNLYYNITYSAAVRPLDIL